MHREVLLWISFKSCNRLRKNIALYYKKKILSQNFSHNDNSFVKKRKDRQEIVNLK